MVSSVAYKKHLGRVNAGRNKKFMREIEEYIQINQVENTKGKKVRMWCVLGGALPLGFIKYNKSMGEFAFYGVNGVGYSREILEHITKFIKKIK